jgi:hypothetical protein
LPPLSNRPALRGPSNGAGVSRSGSATATPPGESIPLTIEPLDEGFSRPRGSTGRPTAPRPLNGRTSGGGDPDPTRSDEEPITPRPAPRRGTGILGRLFGPPPAPLPPPRDEFRTGDKPKPRSDPDPESGLERDTIARRRIERQISATLGDKVRSFDVSVTGRNVVIFAQPSRFWLRRSVRRSLETLPVLQGYRARIDVSE